MNGPRRIRAVALAAAVLALLVGCSSPTLVTPLEPGTDMTPTEAKRINQEIVDAIHRVVGDDGWDVGESWDYCGEDPPSEQYVMLGKRQLPLLASPDDIAAEVRDALTALGYDGLHVEHDLKLEPPRSIVAYPWGYLRGSDPDGFGFEFDAGEGFAFFEVAGHCVVTEN